MNPDDSTQNDQDLASGNGLGQRLPAGSVSSLQSDNSQTNHGDNDSSTSTVSYAQSSINKSITTGDDLSSTGLQQDVVPIERAQVGATQATQEQAHIPLQQVPIASPEKVKRPIVIKRLVILIAGIVCVIAIIGLSIFVLTRVLSEKPSEPTVYPSNMKEMTSSQQKKIDGNTIVAKYFLDYSAVCDGGRVSNAGKLTQDGNQIITLYKSHDSGDWQNIKVGFGEPYYPEYEKVEKISVVACLYGIPEATFGEQKCEYNLNGLESVVDHQTLQYELRYFEASSGKQISIDTSNIAAPADRCPVNLTDYDASSNKSFASPEARGLETANGNFKLQYPL